MRITFFAAVLLLITSLSASAQYSYNRTIYDYRYYHRQIGDPYDPTVAGALSFLMPGLGQMLTDELGRGLGFLAGDVGCVVLTFIGANIAMFSDDPVGPGLMLTGIAGSLAVYIWSIADAVRVAKVNNMAWHGASQPPAIQLQPGLITSYNGKLSPGLTLSLRF